MRQRQTDKRSKLRRARFRWMGTSLLVALFTLAALEAALAAAGLPAYYPAHLPDAEVSLSPWWTCDQPGCHFVHDAARAACESGELDGRPCLVNRQGFPDADDFDAADSTGSEPRLLILGDSFAFGMKADIGMSFVETLETALPGSLIWNAAIPGAGTNQAIATFKVFGSRLRPQITLLAFFTNDFDDNLLPIDSWLNAVGADGKAINVRRYLVGDGEEVVELDLRSIQLMTIFGKEPPENELEYRLGSTRLGAIALRLIDSLRAEGAQHERYDRRRETTRAYLQELRDLVAENDSAFLVLLIPAPEDISSPGLRYTIAAQLLSELGIPYLAPRGMLERAEDYAPPPDIHWSNSGHQKVGVMLSECINVILNQGSPAGCEHVVLP